MATVRLQLRRGIADDWFDANPTLAPGEIGIETDTNTFKFGDGNTPWRSLAYALSGTVDDYIPLNTKAQAGGVASLDSSGFVPTSQLPPLAKVTVSAVANQAARLALTAEAGDIAIQADNGQSYVLASSPASTDGNWRALVGSEAVVDTVESALIAGTGLDKTYDDASGTITIDIDSTVATKTYADQAEADAITAAAADATSKANAAQAAAISAASTALTNHEADTTNVHGIADTSVLATATTVATAKSEAIAAAASAAGTALSTHEADTTNVHGIANTALLATTANVATAKAEAILAAETYTDAFVGAAPGALNSLAELATALGSDANFSTTITNSLALKSPLASPTFTGTVTLPATTSIGDVTNVEIGYLTSVTSDIQGQFNLKAPLASPTLTGTVTLPESTSIGDVNNLEIGYLNGVTSSIQGQIDAKLASATAASTYAPLASPTLTGTVTLPESTSIGDVNNLEIGYLNGVTSSIQGQIDAKLASATAASTYAPLASPTLTGTVTLPESTSIGNVSNLEIGYLNNVTSSIQGQIDEKLASATAATTYAPLATPTFTGTVTLPETTSIGNVSNVEIGYLNNVTSSIQGQIDLKAPLASPTFTGTVTLPENTITQSMMSDNSVGTAEIIASSVTSSELAVDAVTEAKIADGAVTSAKIANLTIVDGDISATAAIATSKISGLDTALGLKAPLDSPTFTGTVSGVTKSHVGLGNVDNTADTAKPVSTAQATAIATAKSEAIADATAQVNAVIASAPAALNTLDELAAALGDDANFATSVTTSLGLKAPLASPTFTGTVTVAAAGVAFTDGTQTKAGVPSLTTIGTEISAAYNLSTGGLALRDQLIPIAGARAITIPTNATTAFPIGTSIDFYQASGTGANFVAADVTVTILRTPGLTLRTTHSSATLTKVATNTWLLAGDLTA